MRRAVTLDTNLLLLFVVGLTSTDHIARHKRLTAYTIRDFERLGEIVGEASELLLLPNTLTETSNLIPSILDPARSEIRVTYRFIINRLPEVHVASVEAAADPDFLRLGLTDTALLALSGDRDVVVLTTDEHLYVAGSLRGLPIFNFNHEPHRVRQRFGEGG